MPRGEQVLDAGDEQLFEVFGTKTVIFVHSTPTGIFTGLSQ